MKNLLAILSLFFIALGTSLFAQSTRSMINDGVDQYHQKKYSDAEVNFKKGLEKAPDSFQGNFNLGDAYYKQLRYDDALKQYQTSLSKTNNEDLKSKAYHNIGNSLLKTEKYKESIDAYKNALKLNPNDNDTKYNLSYALNMLNQKQDQKDKNKNDKNKDQDKDKKDQDKKDQDKKDQNKDNKDQDKKDQQKQPQQPEKNKISKEQAEQILNALKNDEKDLQKKLRKKVGVPVKTDKDW